MSASVQAGSGKRSRRPAAAEAEATAPEEREEQEEQGSPAEESTGISPAALAEAFGKEILNQVEARPYTTILVAAATGYVIGVGTPNWVTKLGWTIASRLAVSKIVASLE